MPYKWRIWVPFRVAALHYSEWCLVSPFGVCVCMLALLSAVWCKSHRAALHHCGLSPPSSFLKGEAAHSSTKGGRGQAGDWQISATHLALAWLPFKKLPSATSPALPWWVLPTLGELDPPRVGGTHQWCQEQSRKQPLLRAASCSEVVGGEGTANTAVPQVSAWSICIPCLPLSPPLAMRFFQTN